jgi:hypothetical protein
MPAKKPYKVIIPANIKEAEVVRRGGTSIYIQVADGEPAWSMSLKDAGRFKSKCFESIGGINLHISISNEILGIEIW